MSVDLNPPRRTSWNQPRRFPSGPSTKSEPPAPSDDFRNDAVAYISLVTLVMVIVFLVLR